MIVFAFVLYMATLRLAYDAVYCLYLTFTGPQNLVLPYAFYTLCFTAATYGAFRWARYLEKESRK